MGPSTRPYAHLNLTRNPFGEPAMAERAPLVVAEIAAAVERLRQPGFAIQFLGEAGRGKTSHLLAIRASFPGAPYVHVGEGERPRIPHGAPLFLDETQRIPAWRRRFLFRRPVSFAIGTHEDHAQELRAAGLEVVTVEPARELTRTRLEAILTRRIEWARRGPGPLPRIPPRTVEALVARAGDDVRTMEHLLYEAFQRSREVGDVEL